MYNFAAPTPPNDQFSRTQTCTLENTASLSTGLWDVQSEVGMILFGMFGMFPVVLSF